MLFLISSIVGKEKLVNLASVILSIMDSVGICAHNFNTYIDLTLLAKIIPDSIKSPFISMMPSIFLEWLNCKPMVKALALVTGMHYEKRDLYSVGRRILTLERLINNHRGFKSEHDYLPDKFYSEEFVEKFTCLKPYLRLEIDKNVSKIALV